MGDRASYALRRPGSRRADVRFAQFGSPFLFGDVFWGPAHAQALIESLEKGPWLDDVYGEAAIAMCLEKQRVAIYSYQLDPHDRLVAARLMQPLWPGWQLRFVTRLTEVTPTVGQDLVKTWARQAKRGAERRRDYYAKREPLAGLGEQQSTKPHDLLIHGIVTLLGERGPADRLFDIDLSAALFAGPALLDALPRALTLPAAERGLRTRLRNWEVKSPADLFVTFRCGPHALLDPASRRLVLTVERGLEESAAYANAHAYAIAWPDWKLTVQRGGLPAHFAATGREVPEVLRVPEPGEPAPTSLDDTALMVASLRRMRALLLEADAEKAAADTFLGRAAGVIEAIAEEAAAGGATVETDGAAGFDTPKGTLSAADKLRLWERAVREAGLEAEAALAAKEADPTDEAAEPAATPTPDERFNEAHLSYRYGNDRNGARTVLDALLAEHPRHARALGLRGRIAYLDGDDAEARRQSQAAIAVDPDDAEPWATLGLVAGRAKDFDELVRCYERALECAPYTWIRNNIASAYLGRAEPLPPGPARVALLERALELATSSSEPSSSLYWAEACALSMLERDADRAWEAMRSALRHEYHNRKPFLEKLHADPQLAWVWRMKEGETLKE
jgi:tetratricopeptide (TPR) repeat protein